MKRIIPYAACFITVLICSPVSAQLNVAIQGQSVNGPLYSHRNLGERDGYAGDRFGQELILDPRVVYQFQVRSYYYAPDVEIWDQRQTLARSQTLTPYHDGRATVYISEVAFRPWRYGKHYMRVKPLGGQPAGGQYVVATYGYIVDDTPPPQPEPPPPPPPDPPQQPVRPAPPPAQPSACTCPSGYEHWYGTVCVGINQPDTAECQ